MSEVLIRGMLCYLGILLVMYDCINFVTSDNCSVQGLTPGGGPAVADLTLTRGCTDDCQTSNRNRQIHVLANNGATDSSREVSVDLYNVCLHQVNVTLVLVSQSPTNWILRYGCFEDDISCFESQYRQRPINLDGVYVIRTRDKNSRPYAKPMDWDEIEPQYFFRRKLGPSFEINWDRQVVLKLQKYFRKKHSLNYVSSISRAWWVGEWHLIVGICCHHEKTTPKTTPIYSTTNLAPTSDIIPPLSPIVTSSLDTGAVSGSNPQEQNILVIAGIVVLIAILIVVILTGTCWYHRKYHKHPEPTDAQEANMSSLEGTGIHVEPNIYNVSPVSNHVDTHDVSEGHLLPEVDPSAPPLPPRPNRA